MHAIIFRQSFRQLIAWKEAHALTLGIYQITQNFPQEERFGISNQLRRAASSVSAQIAEGSQMSSMAHRKLYYDRAYASAAEVDNFLELSKDLQYVSEETYNKFLNHVNRVCFLVRKLALSQRQTFSLSQLSILSQPSSPTQASHNHATAAAHSPDE